MSLRCWVANFHASSSVDCAWGRFHGGDNRNFSLCTRFARLITRCKLSFCLIAFAAFSCFFNFFFSDEFLSPPIPDMQKRNIFRSKPRAAELSNSFFCLSVCLSIQSETCCNSLYGETETQLKSLAFTYRCLNFFCCVFFVRFNEIIP